MNKNEDYGWYEDKVTGFKHAITKNSIIIELPFENLVNGFNLSPNNYDEVEIKKGMEQYFADWLVQNVFDEANPDTGDSFIPEMLDRIYERAYEDDLDFVDYKEGGEE